MTEFKVAELQRVAGDLAALRDRAPLPDYIAEMLDTLILNVQEEVLSSDPREVYLEWLAMEARLLRIEMYGNERFADPETAPCNTAAQSFHFPHDRSWQDVPPPSTRAELVLATVGVLPRLTQ